MLRSTHEAFPKSFSDELFARYEPLMKELGRRPHWGKHFTLTPEDPDVRK
jgi:hypothetical protein